MVRAKVTHSGGDEELEDFGREVGEEVPVGGGFFWKAAIMACRVARENYGSGGLEAAALRSSSSAVRFAT